MAVRWAYRKADSMADRLGAWWVVSWAAALADALAASWAVWKAVSMVVH